MNQGDPQEIHKIFFHWTATDYNWKLPNHYHTVLTGDGNVHRLHPYKTFLPEHTAQRNENAVALSLACMGGTGFTQYPPTNAQIESMCQEAAAIALGEEWPCDADYLQYHMMTHAEAAALRDYPFAKVRFVSGLPMYQTRAELQQRTVLAKSYGLPHDNYGPDVWPDNWPGGYVERWDLYKLHAQDSNGSGGHQLRIRILNIMKEHSKK